MKVETMLDIFGLSSNYNFMKHKERQKPGKKDLGFTPIIWLQVFILISDNLKSNSLAKGTEVSQRRVNCIIEESIQQCAIY